MTRPGQPCGLSAWRSEKDLMMRKTPILIALFIATLALPACTPLLVGGAAAVVADEVIEQDQGGDGLF
jgi:hypothetical protein